MERKRSRDQEIKWSSGPVVEWQEAAICKPLAVRRQPLALLALPPPSNRGKRILWIISSLGHPDAINLTVYRGAAGISCPRVSQ